MCFKLIGYRHIVVRRSIFFRKKKLYDKADMVRIILETEKIYFSYKIQNINKVAVQAKNCELLTLVISVRFFLLLLFQFVYIKGLLAKTKLFQEIGLYFIYLFFLQKCRQVKSRTFISEIKLHAITYFVYSLSSNNKHFYDDRDRSLYVHALLSIFITMIYNNIKACLQ